MGRDHLMILINLYSILRQGQEKLRHWRMGCQICQFEQQQKGGRKPWQAVSAIHGASKKNLKRAYDGMFYTLQKRCKMKDLTNYLTNYVVSEHYKKRVERFWKIKRKCGKEYCYILLQWCHGQEKISKC